MTTVQVDVDPSLTIIAQGVSPYPPVLLKVAQVDKYVQVVARVPLLTTSFIVTELALYRAPAAEGPYTQIDRRQISDISLQNNLFDLDPVFGSTNYYACTSIDYNLNESALTEPVEYTAANS